jgi:hypothetical protein
MIARARAGLQNTDVRSQTSAAAADRINGYLSPVNYLVAREEFLTH